jgi:hypothetical protein
MFKVFVQQHAVPSVPIVAKSVRGLATENYSLLINIMAIGDISQIRKNILNMQRFLFSVSLYFLRNIFPTKLMLIIVAILAPFFCFNVQILVQSFSKEYSGKNKSGGFLKLDFSI